ncbi:carboxypeptidase regulatory-like domain-containing protein [Mucilaginibacter xinganensis]|uniref:MG2 domain protein n=1 Tax=Mucilaginibacter xinganensis TaxID=1234841 RepID=A0A223NSV2_9SPHI|nr:carboxypeptidase regulatory-like domain-containing protein [Mucilaginibacter xinganensis]ASU32979.1 MG2 domain protein [Mucilaginibacter xinganensis]
MKKSFFTVILFVALHATAFCQGSSPVLENAVSKIQSTITGHIIEKAYLHLDRPYPYYVAGEVVYFKAYVTMGELHEPSRISGILHADLLGKGDVILQSENIQLTNGVGWGDFVLPDTLQKGSYRIRAYTNWMRNGDHAYYFDQHISVSSINNVDRVTAVAKMFTQPAIQFFPEAGNLVTDLQSKVAFKAVGTDGLGINVKGVILDNENKEVAKIAATHLGMGVFNLTPEEGKKYKAKITYSDGSQSTVNLPDVEAKGITLAVNSDDPAKISMEIKANRAYYKENMNKELNLLIYWAGSVKKINTKLDNSVLGLDVPTGTLRTGILQVTLFSQTGEPLNERLAFIQNPDLLNLSLNTGKPSFAKRENVKLNFNAKDNTGSPATGSFSVSVIDESKILVDENAESTILSNLLLTTDLKGYVEKPNYYFANITKETRANLDVLMLTQGYRRFAWKQLLSDNSTAAAAAYQPERTIDITGKVKSKAGVPMPNVTVTLLPGAGGAVKTAATDATGSFKFADMVFNSGERFVLKTQSSSGKNAAVITLDAAASAAGIDAGNGMYAGYNSNADILSSLQSSLKSGDMTASNESKVYLKGDKVTGARRNDNYRSSNLGGSGHADQVIHGDDIADASTLLTALNGIARGVDFINGVPYLKTAQIASATGSGAEPMLIVINGVKGAGTGGINAIEPRAVETVEILKGTNASIYGLEGGAGAIVITTRMGAAPGAAASKEMAPGVFSFTPTGFYKAKEFYSPNYEVAQPAGKMPDARTTIFWKPDVVTGTDGNATFNFFNADGTGTYRVVVEGIDSKGNIGRQVYKYKVE